MANEYVMPTPNEIQAGIDEGRRLRAEYTQNLLRSAFKAVRAMPSKVAHLLHLPAHS